MKRTTVLLGAFLTAFAVQAQNFKIAHPAFTSYFKMTATDVNIRKSPNVKADRMMLWHSDAGSYFTETVAFYPSESGGRYRASNRTGAWVEPAHPFKGEILPLLGRSGDWVNILNYSKKGYMMAKFGKVCNLANGINVADLETYLKMTDTDLYMPGYSLYSRSGRYSEMSFTAYVWTGDDVERHVTVVFPFVVNGKYMCIVQIYMLVETSPSAPVGRIRYVRDELAMDDMESYIIYLNVADKNDKNIAETAIKKVQNMSDSEFVSLFKHSFPERAGEVISECIGKTTDGEVIGLTIESDNQYNKMYNLPL